MSPMAISSAERGQGGEVDGAWHGGCAEAPRKIDPLPRSPYHSPALQKEAPMEVGLVRRIDIDHEMQQSYLDYAMSVIVARALPDARDGPKPGHPRILHAMHDMGMRATGRYRK